MFPTFIGILDIQSWWEVPSIAHFCSLFRAAFNLLDFDIEDLEEALLTDGGSEGRLVQELIVRLLVGCLPPDSRNDISIFNYQMFLRRLFRKKCQEYKCENPFNTDVDFELLPLRQKVEILRALCDFRLDAEDVECALSNLDSDSLRVEPLGHDRKNSAYWYFYGTRLYREDFVENEDQISVIHSQRGRPRDKKRKRRSYKSEVVKKVEKKEEEKAKVDDNNSCDLDTDKTRDTVWQVICFTQQDWTRLVDKFRDSEYEPERKLYHTLAEDFLPEIPKLFELKEKQQRNRLLQRNNSRVHHSAELKNLKETIMVRAKIKSKVGGKNTKKSGQSSKGGDSDDDVSLPPPTPSLPPPPPQKKGRQTNNSLASAVGQIVIHTGDESDKVTNKKIGKHGASYVSSGYPYTFGIEDEERRIGMHKVLESVKDHVDAWPFIDPVDEEYAPRYYSVVRKPMDLRTMEEKLEGGSYKNLYQFRRDFRLIVDNCRQYNGSDNEYTEMAVNLKDAFERAIERYLESEPSSDESPSVAKLPSVSSLPYPLRTTSPNPTLSSLRKRNKKSNKKSKLNKNERKTKKNKNRDDDAGDYNDDYFRNDHHDDRGEDSKTLRDRRAKKRAKSMREDTTNDDDDNDDDDNDDDDDDVVDNNDDDHYEDGAISESTVIKSKRTKYSDVGKLLPKTKRLLAKDEVKNNVVRTKSVGGSKKSEKDNLFKKLSKDHKESRKKKDDFEESHEPLENIKSKNKRIEKKSADKDIGMMDKIKKIKQKKQIDNNCDDDNNDHDNNNDNDDDVDDDGNDNDKYSDIDENRKQSTFDKKKNWRKVKNDTKIRRTDSETSKYGDSACSPSRIKDKNSKSKKPNVELTKNGKVNSCDSEKEQRRKDDTTVTTMKFDSLLSNKDLESLDSLKDRISERSRRDEKLKLERDKLKKSSKSELHKKKVPSNGHTFHDNSDRVNIKRLKVKKASKDKKSIVNSTPTTTTTTTDKDQQVVDGNKNKSTKHKGRVESPVIQALNQATAQTVNDLNKWFDGTPPTTDFNSKEFTTLQVASTSDQHRVGSKAPDVVRKRSSNMKLFGTHGPPKPKKVQRTIDRLQPGKSKGNLLLKKPLGSNGNTSDSSAKETTDVSQSRVITDEPKLSLGTVLKNVDSIQLICRSLVSSPSANLSNEDDDDRTSVLNSSTTLGEDKSQKLTQEAVTPKTQVEITKNIKEAEDSQKPKSATPNLSAWFKAFGAPKSKKKEEDVEEPIKKEESQEITLPHRQRRHSAGGSSVSESMSSFSQESPPGLSARSPQTQSAVPTPSIEQPVRAGFYQDALSVGSSPYNSPYYTTPPRYSAQLPPTPSPQNHPLSPAYPSSAAYEQNSMYPGASHQIYQKPPSVENPNESFNYYPQNSPQGDAYSQQLSSSPKPSPVYPQASPQPVPVYQNSPQSTPPNYSQQSPQQPPTPNYSQPSPQPPTVANYSQPSPQQPAVANYSQPSPQQPAVANFSQPSPQQPTVTNYSQPSPQHPTVANYSQPSPQQTPSNYSQPSPQQQQQHSPYSHQPSPQPLANYSQSSPQQQQPSASYSQPSPKPPPSYSQVSPQPLTTYNQSSPQFNQQSSSQSSANYSQPSPQSISNYSQPSPQTHNFSQPSPQPPKSYTQSSPQNIPPYSTQPSPQSQNYSQPSPQPSTTPAPAYASQVSPQPPRSYSQPSPHVTQSAMQTGLQQSVAYPQQSPRQQTTPIYTQPDKSTDEYQSQAPAPYPQGIKPNHIPYVPIASNSVPEAERRVPEYFKPEDKTTNINSNQVYHQTNQFTSLYPTNNYSINDRVSCPPVSENQRPTSRISTQDQPPPPQQQQQQQSTQQQQQQAPTGPSSQERPYDTTENLKYSQQRSDQPQLLAFQQNLPTHEAIYQSSPGFQTTPYPLSNASCRPVYTSSHYYDTSVKSTPPTSVPSTLAPVKKRMYNEPVDRNCIGQESRTGQEQFGYDQMMSLATSSESSIVPNQYESFGALADSVANNPAYARLSLGLVGRSSKDQQQLLSIPRPSSKDSLVYSRAGPASEYDLNLLQNMQGTKSMPAIQSPRRESSTSSVPTIKIKKTRKKTAQAQQPTISSALDQSLSSFPQYSTNPADVGLKNSSVVPPPVSSAFNFTQPGATNSSPFYDKDTSAAAAAFAFLDEFRNPSYYSILRQQQQQQQQQPQSTPTISESAQQANKLNNQPRNYPPHPFLHSTQRSAPYGPPVSYVSPHGPNLSVDPAAYQQYIHSLYALQPPPPSHHHHRPSWL